MNFSEALKNDIFAPGDVIAFPGVTMKEKFEKPDTPYRHVGVIIDDKTFIESVPGGTRISYLEDVEDFVLVKTGLRLDRRMLNFITLKLCSEPLKKYSRIHSWLNIYKKNSPYKMTSATLVGTILINNDYHLVLKGLTPSRLVDVLTKLYGRKIVRITK